MNRNERANYAAESGFVLPSRIDGKPAYADFGSIAAVAAPIIGGAISGKSAGKAAASQAAATGSAIAEQQRQYDQTRQDNAPYRQAGSQAINRLSTLLGLNGGVGGNSDNPYLKYSAPEIQTMRDSLRSQLAGTNQSYDANLSPEIALTEEALNNPNLGKDPSQDPEFGSLNKKFTLADFWDDPVTKASFQFGLDQGTKALDNMAGARGNRNSGAQLKALTRFGTDYTGQQAAGSQARYVNDQTNIYNRLAGISGAGQQSVNATSQAGAGSSNNISQLLSSQGNARGAAQIAQGNAFGGAVNQIGNYYNSQNTLDKLLNAGRNVNFYPDM